MAAAARITDMHTCPLADPKSHVGGPILPGSNTSVLIGSLPAATVGNSCVCVGPPDALIKGSVSVKIGGKPAVRMGDSTAHGGSITGGFPTVNIGG
ncbi:PAAR domain-containing protein [Flavobacterium sp.]|uniref:PAAR domain-containing protein n=1 Tax=Flavobacterium sp. TaxID=239 RepID=UPI00286AECCF|nr:PAAR domain-containing protein [Flavobacterium sp.]